MCVTDVFKFLGYFYTSQAPQTRHNYLALVLTKANMVYGNVEYGSFIVIRNRPEKLSQVNFLTYCVHANL